MMVGFELLCREQVPADFKQIDAYAHQYKGSSARCHAVSDFFCVLTVEFMYQESISFHV